MDELPAQDQTPQTTPPELSVPDPVKPAEPLLQNEAIETPPAEPILETKQNASTGQTPQIEPATLPQPLATVPDLTIKARAAIQSKKRKKLNLILEEVAKQGSISNNEVEKLLGVSDATASRYLVTLQKEGSLKRIGRTGKAVRYELAS